MAAVRIMIVDRPSERRVSLETALNLNEGIAVVSVVSSRERAVNRLSSDPDVILLNPAVLKGRDPASFLGVAGARSPVCRVLLLLEGTPTDEELVAHIKAGMRGYVHADDPAAIIAKAARAVSRGETWAERRVLVKAISRPLLLSETLDSHVPALAPLTGREREMLVFVIQGATNREIAENSKISERTVKTHLYRIYKKLNVKSRTKAIALLSQS